MTFHPLHSFRHMTHTPNEYSVRTLTYIKGNFIFCRHLHQRLFFLPQNAKTATSKAHSRPDTLCDASTIRHHQERTCRA